MNWGTYQLQNKNRSGRNTDIRTLDTIKPEIVSLLSNEKPAEILFVEGKTIRLKAGDNKAITLKITGSKGTLTPGLPQIRLITK